MFFQWFVYTLLLKITVWSLNFNSDSQFYIQFATLIQIQELNLNLKGIPN